MRFKAEGVIPATLVAFRADFEIDIAASRKHLRDVADVVVDEAHKIVTTPAYMLAESISEAAVGINKLVKYVLAFSQ